MAYLFALFLSFALLQHANCQSACSDVVSYCAFYQQYNYCQLYPDYMKTYCAKTCGFCSIAPTTRPQPTTQQPIPTGPAQKEFQCSFEGDFCNWNNEHIGDAADWAVGTVAGGPSSGADGTPNYAYVNARSSGYNARLVLPWEIVLPVGTTYVGSMCLNFRFQTGNGNLKFIEDKYPDSNNKNPSPINKGTFSGSGSWVYGKVQVQVDNRRALVIEGTPGSSGKIVIDELFFVKGSC